MIDKALAQIKECLQTNDFVLRLVNCGIEDHYLKPDSPFFKALNRCTHVKILNLSDNRIRAIKGLDNLTQLQSLDLSYNSITEINNLSHLLDLDELSLHGNQISQITGLEKLTKLTSLSLYGNSISEIDGLQNLINLKSLFLGANRISKIQGIEKLIKLNLLYIGNNRIKSISGLEKLTTLSRLHLNNNELVQIEGLDNLTQIIEIDLSNNEIRTANGLGNLIRLERLYLNNNQLSEVNQLSKLIKLQVLDLSSNEIINIQPLIPLLKLDSKSDNTNIGRKKESLFVNKYRLNKEGDRKGNKYLKSNTPDSFFASKYPSARSRYPIKLRMDNNPLTTPPIEIANQGNNAILNFFDAVGRQGIEYLYEAKMLIVGQPRAGKTSLKYKLINTQTKLPTEDKTTRGIDIDRLSFDVKDTKGNNRKFFYNVWDFGGQHIYHTTHQFFLTNRSLYILVLDTGRDSVGNDDTSINYWMQIVELLGRDSPMILVCNEKNERQLNIDIPAKRARFNFLKHEYSINFNALIKTAENFDERQFKSFKDLKDDIENELRHLPLVGFAMPKNWVKIRTELQEFSVTHPHISRNEFMEICYRNSVLKFEEQMKLSRIFHDLGVFLHFQDYPLLEDIIILRNTWATDAVFAVLDNPTVRTNKGRFTEVDILNIWKHKDYDPQVYRKLLSLMMQFELCYQLEAEKPSVYIIPELLSDSPPKAYIWKENNDLKVYYKYDFMPKGVLTRLIVRLHNYIAKVQNTQIVWKTGLNIDGKHLMCVNTFAEITETWDNKQLVIRIQGLMSRELMSKLTGYIDELNNELFRQVANTSQTPKTQWHKLIPCNCETCKNDINKYFHDYAEILKRIEFGKETIECRQPPNFYSVNISDLIEGVFSTLKNNFLLKNKTLDGRSIKVFLASSLELEPERTKFELFIAKENERLNKKGISIKLISSDYFIDAVSQTKLQDEYNKAIAQCDLFVMIYSSKVGKFTLEEFEVALGQFRATNNPKIYTYLIKKNIINNEMNRDDINSFFAFQDRLKEIGHYYKRVNDALELQVNFKWQLEQLYGI